MKTTQQEAIELLSDWMEGGECFCNAELIPTRGLCSFCNTRKFFEKLKALPEDSELGYRVSGRLGEHYMSATGLYGGAIKICHIPCQCCGTEEGQLHKKGCKEIGFSPM